MYAPQLIGERLEILERIVPKLDKVAMTLNGNNTNNAAQFELLRSEARKLDIEVQSLDIRKPEDVDAAFDKALAFGAKGLLNAVDTFINSRRFVLAAGAMKYKLPFVYSDVEYVLAGGLMALVQVIMRAITVPPGTWTRYCAAQTRLTCRSQVQHSS
jgi:putative ABC transport system substrate-binding protein